jgi:hypothetical protein
VAAVLRGAEAVINPTMPLLEAGEYWLKLRSHAEPRWYGEHGQASESARCGRVPGGCVVNDTDVREADLWTRRAPMTKQEKQYVR